MVKIYLVVLVVVVLLLALPSTRRIVLSPRAYFANRDNPGAPLQRATDAARTATDAARTAGGNVVSGQIGRQLQKLSQTLVIQAAPEQVGPILIRAMEDTAVIDPVPPVAGESLAWNYSSLTDTRFAAVPAAEGHTVFGVVSFEFSMRTPQGGSAADQAIDKVRAGLSEQGIAFVLVARTFEPGVTITADGPRTAQPLA